MNKSDIHHWQRAKNESDNPSVNPVHGVVFAGCSGTRLGDELRKKQKYSGWWRSA